MNRRSFMGKGIVGGIAALVGLGLKKGATTKTGSPDNTAQADAMAGNTWSHIAISHNKDQGGELYINGAYVGKAHNWHLYYEDRYVHPITISGKELQANE